MKIFIYVFMIFCFLSTNAFAIGKNGFRKSSTITTGQITCTTSATLILAADGGRQSFILHRETGAAVYIGGSGVTTANGYIMANHESLSDSGPYNYIGAIYCIMASSTNIIHFITVGW